MIKIIITTIILFIIFIILLLSFNVKIEYFNDLTSREYTILKDTNNNNINPIVWYKFDSTNLNKDEINANNNLSFNSGTADKAEFKKGSNQTGSSLLLRNGGFAKMPLNLNLNSINKANGITFSFYAKLEPSCGWWSRIFDFGMQSINVPSYGSRSILIARLDGENRLIFYISSRDPCCPGYEDAGYAYIQNENYFDGRWRHYTWSITKEGYWNIYVNGDKLIGNFYTNRIIPEFNNNNGKQHNYFGKSLYNHDGGLDANIDDFRIYDRILNDEQVYKLANGYNRVGEIIDTSTNCTIYNTSSGIIRQIPPANMNITIVSPIKRLNDAVYEQTFGDGTTSYTITFSKFHSDNYSPIKLFRKTNVDDIIAYSIDNYDDKGDYIGVFINNPDLGLNNFSEKGDFLHFRFPSKITLKRYGFVADKNWVSRAPGTWVIYGLNRTRNEMRQLVKNTQRLNNNNYCVGNLYTFIQNINENTFECDEIIFIFTGLASSTSQNSPGRVLSFTEILLYSS